MRSFVTVFEQHYKTVGVALVLVIGTFILMEVLGQFMPVLGNPLLLVAGPLVVLALYITAWANRTGPLRRPHVDQATATKRHR